MSESIIQKKSFKFALMILEFYKEMIKHNEFIISKQLLRCGTSIGANVEEALAGQSKKDFIAKMTIASKEARETHYWLRLIKESNLINTDIETILKETEEIIKILTSIVKTSQLKITHN